VSWQPLAWGLWRFIFKAGYESQRRQAGRRRARGPVPWKLAVGEASTVWASDLGEAAG
jgi:hypothetical protein